MTRNPSKQWFRSGRRAFGTQRKKMRTLAKGAGYEDALAAAIDYLGYDPQDEGGLTSNEAAFVNEYLMRHQKEKNPQRKNPSKAQKRLNASKRSKQKRMAAALKKYLQQQNPGMKLAGAQVQRLKGGAVKITPIKIVRGHK